MIEGVLPMLRSMCLTTAGLALALTLALTAGAGGAGDKVWKKEIPGPIVRALINREARMIEKLAGGKIDDDSRRRVQPGAGLIAGLLLSSADGGNTKTRDAALKIAGLAGKKGSEDEIKKLAGGIKDVV